MVLEDSLWLQKPINRKRTLAAAAAIAAAASAFAVEANSSDLAASSVSSATLEFNACNSVACDRMISL